MKYVKTFKNFVTEANDLSYWSQYDKSDHNQIEDWMFDEAKTVSEVIALVDKCIINWNKESDKNNKLSKSDESAVGDLAMHYFKQFRSINGNIITAMIAQA